MKSKAKRIDNGEWVACYYFRFNDRHYISTGTEMIEVDDKTVCKQNQTSNQIAIVGQTLKNVSAMCEHYDKKQCDCLNGICFMFGQPESIDKLTRRNEAKKAKERRNYLKFST